MSARMPTVRKSGDEYLLIENHYPICAAARLRKPGGVQKFRTPSSQS
jgi:hypothetical protein